MRWLASTLGLATLLVGCDARFSDLRDAPGDGGRTEEPPPFPEARVVARGAFGGRAGHQGQGDAELLEGPDGTRQLRLADNFAASPVPGPFLFLSSREEIGTGLDEAQDLELGSLRSPTGEQRYTVRTLDETKRVVWVYCRPYRVEVARAILDAVP